MLKEKKVNLKQYKELCRACDHVLLMSRSTLETVCISWLHVMRPHPVFLVNYYDLFCSSYIKRKVLEFKRRIKYFVISTIGFLLTLNNKLLKIKTPPWYECQKIERNVDIIFISHLLNESQINKCEDLYFDNMPGLLSDKGYSVAVILINHTGKHEKQLITRFSKTKIPRVIVSNSLGFDKELELYRRMKEESVMLRKEYEKEDCKPLKRALLRASQEAMSNATSGTLRKFEQFKGILKKYKPKVLITTYEGHAWEKAAFGAARQSVQSIRCFGYQHAAVFEHQHAIKRKLNEKYNPDVVLTSGIISKDIFEKNQIKLSKIICIGSYKHLIPGIEDKKNQCCLVVPEGFVLECSILFKLSLDYAKQYPNQQFIWRLHPLLNFDDIRKHGVPVNSLPSNIHLSKDSLDNDIKKCNSALYRGSTVIVNAINAGLKPIYYKQSTDELSIDPIYQQQQGKEIISNKNELHLALNKKIDIKTKKILQDFAQDFYAPLNIAPLLQEFNNFSDTI